MGVERAVTRWYVQRQVLLYEIAELEARVRRISGVRGVHNLLHLRGTPAPNKVRSQNSDIRIQTPSG